MLGPLEVVADDGTLVELGGKRPRALLANLLLHAGEAVSTDRLIDGIWGEAPPASAHGALQVHVHALRKALGPDRIVTRAPGYLLRVEPGELDVERFERLVERGAIGDLEEALALWRGPALADVAHEPFAHSEAARLEERRTTVLEQRISVALAAGRHAELVGELEGLVSEQPHREGLQAHRMLALYRSGRQADALAAYRQARDALDELGIAPSAELRSLEQRILQQDPGLDVSPPYLREVQSETRHLIGRDLERATLQALVDSGEHALVTVTGTPGIGKTALALAVTGVEAVVDLAAVEDADLVVGEIGKALGCTETAARPYVDVVADALASRRGVILVDNFEQVLAARGDLAIVLERAPGARLVVTSRVPLRIAGEREYRLAPLEVPAPGEHGLADVAGVPAVELYVACARATMPGFALTEGNAAAVARIGRLLDGIPLAIELAAARIRALGPEATAARLGEGIALLRKATPDRPERQRSVRAAIDWSYRLLEPDEQRWFRAVGALAGGGTLELVEALRGGADASDALDALVDASLVVHRADEDGRPRFSMLQPIREHALELLAAHGETDRVRDAHLDHLLDAAADADAARRRDLGSYPTAGFRLEVDNFRAALDHATREPGDDRLARLTCALAIFWTLEEAFEEGLSRFDSARASLREAAPPQLRFGVLNGGGLFRYFRGDLAGALELNEQALAAGGDAVEPGELGRALRLRSSIAKSLGRPEEALAALERAIPLLERAGDGVSAGRSLFTVSDARRRAGDIPGAVEAGRRSADVLTAIGDVEGAGFAWLVVASAHVTAGAHAEAVDAIGRGLSLAETVGDTSSIETAALLRSRVAADRGDVRLGAVLLGYAQAAYAPRGAARWELEREYWEPVESVLAARMEPDERLRLVAEGAQLQQSAVASLVREPL